MKKATNTEGVKLIDDIHQMHKEKRQEKVTGFRAFMKRVLRGIGYVVYGFSVSLVSVTGIVWALQETGTSNFIKLFLICSAIAITPVLYIIGQGVLNAIVAAVKQAAKE